MLLAIGGWLLIGCAGAYVARGWSVGPAVFLVVVWVASLGVAAPSAVRGLFGPVFFYEVVRNSRRRTTFLLRGIYTMCISASLALAYVLFLESERIPVFSSSRVVSIRAMSGFSEEFFTAFVIIQHLTLLLLTPVSVAGAITVEKERKTLEFLLATDLRNREIIFGKLIARVLGLLMYLLAGLPIIAMLQLFGGVDPEQFLAAFTVTAISVIGLAVLSIWFSTMMRKARDAIILTYLSFLAFHFTTFMAAGFATFSMATPTYSAWWKDTIDFAGWQFSIDDSARGLASGNIAWQLLVLANGSRAGLMAGLGDQLRQYAMFWGISTVVLLGHAILRIRAVTLKQTYSSPSPTRSRKKTIKNADGKIETRIVNEATSKYPPVGDHPVFWKEVFPESAGRGGCLWRIITGFILLLIFGTLLLIINFVFLTQNNLNSAMNPSERWYFFTGGLNVWVRIVIGALCSLIFLGTTIRGSGAISGEQDKDTWLSLISTPLTLAELLWGKWWGTVLGMRKAWFVAALVLCIGVGCGAVEPLIIPPILVLFGLYTSAFAWIGLYCSMTTSNTLVANVRGFFLALFAGGGFWVVGLIVIGIPLSLIDDSHQDTTREIARISEIFGSAIIPTVSLIWIPQRNFERLELRPLKFDGTHDVVDFTALILPFVVWSVVNLLLYTLCASKLRKLTYRNHPPLRIHTNTPAERVT